jgi:MFS family permease
MEPLALSGTIRIFGSIFLGILFGFIIFKAGFHDRKTIFNQFKLQDNQWLKVFFFSIFIGVILFYLLNNWGIVNIHIRPGFFWATIAGAILTSAGLLICGHLPSTALTALGTGRFYAIWILLGMLMAIPATSFISEFLSDTIYNWAVPFSFEDRLDDYFSSRINVVLWIGCLSLIAALLLEITFKKQKEE